jgi:hypothetical protein
VACATSIDNGASVGLVDSGGGADTTIPVATGSSSGSDSGLPTVTIYSDGGGTMNPTTDSGQTQPTGSGSSTSGYAPPGTGDGGYAPPPGDGGSPLIGDGGFPHDGAFDGHHRDGSHGSSSASSTGGGSSSSHHHSSGSASSSAGGSVPTTCAETNQGYGCCLGDTVYWCSTNHTVGSTACTGSKVCGWSTSAGEYECVTAPGKADPAGTYPMDCP